MKAATATPTQFPLGVHTSLRSHWSMTTTSTKYRLSNVRRLDPISGLVGLASRVGSSGSYTSSAPKCGSLVERGSFLKLYAARPYVV